MRLWLTTLVLCTAGLANAADTLIELGPSQVGNRYSGTAILTVSQRWDDRLQLTFGIIGAQEADMCGRPDCVWQTDEQLLFGGEVLLEPLWFWTDRLKFGIGPYIKTRPDRFVSSFLMAGLLVEYRFSEHMALVLRHWSNASSGLVLPYCNDWGSCGVHDYNNGHDSWLRFQVRW